MFGRFNAPKGLYDSARGFNPGNRSKPHRALKRAPNRTRVRTCVYCEIISRPFQGESLEGMVPQGFNLGNLKMNSSP
jgi:hypothetical protein